MPIPFKCWQCAVPHEPVEVLASPDTSLYSRTFQSSVGTVRLRRFHGAFSRMRTACSHLVRAAMTLSNRQEAFGLLAVIAKLVRRVLCVELRELGALMTWDRLAALCGGRGVVHTHNTLLVGAEVVVQPGVVQMSSSVWRKRQCWHTLWSCVIPRSLQCSAAKCM